MDTILLSLGASALAFLAGWYVRSVSKRLEKHGGQIDALYEATHQIALAMASDHVTRGEFEDRMRRVEDKLQALAVELGRLK